jgi:hypothetical protein
MRRRLTKLNSGPGSIGSTPPINPARFNTTPMIIVIIAATIMQKYHVSQRTSNGKRYPRWHIQMYGDSVDYMGNIEHPEAVFLGACVFQFHWIR